MLLFLAALSKRNRKIISQKIDIPLLIRWHQEFPATIYEKHRNYAIFFIQGNRNPFIDVPELAERMIFPLTLS